MLNTKLTDYIRVAFKLILNSVWNQIEYFKRMNNNVLSKVILDYAMNVAHEGEFIVWNLENHLRQKCYRCRIYNSNDNNILDHGKAVYFVYSYVIYITFDKMKNSCQNLRCRSLSVNCP